ncbi:hypothetical protein CEXT_619281 [Caerostris extrusa]|uniref:Uncharacterized protein n=1 Tax=Caerostris extrusa TaxID=172846 RepID=A0AAV4MLE9_CAEEX|nr:hypothetical protein CEXT_619281 [Caerostris extrusa]
MEASTQLEKAASRRNSMNGPVSTVKAKDSSLLVKMSLLSQSRKLRKRQFSNFSVILRPNTFTQNLQYFSTGIICLSRRRQRSDFH